MLTVKFIIDPRERHSVIKLDRYELEDKYLRLLDEASNLKKLSNIQEDKIKRLATKLMRAVANPRPSSACLNVCDDKNKLIALELENSKVLRYRLFRKNNHCSNEPLLQIHFHIQCHSDFMVDS